MTWADIDRAIEDATYPEKCSLMIQIVKGEIVPEGEKEPPKKYWWING